MKKVTAMKNVELGKAGRLNKLLHVSSWPGVIIFALCGLFQLCPAAANEVWDAPETTVVGFSNYGSPITIIKEYRDFGVDTSYIAPQADKGGFGCDFGGFRTVYEISFDQFLKDARRAITSLDVYTSAGVFPFVITYPGGVKDTVFENITIDLGGIDTSYVFIVPTGMDSRYDGRPGVANLVVSTSGDFVPWTNLAYGKEVICSGYVPSEDNSTLSLTNGVLHYGYLNDGRPDPPHGTHIIRFDNARNAGDEDIWSFLQIDLGNPVLLNTFGLFQAQEYFGGKNDIVQGNPANDNACKTPTVLKLEFWADNPAEVTTYILSTTPETFNPDIYGLVPGDYDLYLFYESMYQQVLFDEDILAQHLKITPLAYNHARQYWGVGEIQLFFDPSANGSDVPEPATWAMFLLGLAALGVYRKRRI